MATTNSSYYIAVEAKLNSANIQKQLDNIASKYKTIRMTLDAKDAVNQANTLTNAVKNADTASKKAKTSMDDLGNSTKKTGQSFLDIVGKVSKFGIATLVINKVRQALMQGVNAVYEMNNSLVEFQKVSDLSGDSLDRYVEKATDLGETVAKTGREMLESATLFKKSGYTEEESLQLSKISSLYQNIADEQISASDASALLVSQMKAFDIAATDSVIIIDQINKVSNEFAVSSSQLATALPKVSATLAQSGNELNEVIGLLTAGSEIMVNESGRVARGLRTIQLRMQGMEEDGEKNAELVPKLGEAYGELGIKLTGTDGQMKSLYDIMVELNEIWPTLDQNTKVYIAELTSGKNNVDVFNSVMLNFTTAINASKAALNSAGSAVAENEKVLDGLKGLINLLKAEFEELSNNVLSSNFLKTLIKVGTALLKFANSDIGQVIIKSTLLTTGLKLLSVSYSLLSISLKEAAAKQLLMIAGTVKATIANIANLASALSLGQAIKVLTVTMLSNPLFWVAAGGMLIFGIAKLIQNASEKFGKLNEEIIKVNAEILKLTDEEKYLEEKKLLEGLTEEEEARLKAVKERIALEKADSRDKAEQAQNEYITTQHRTEKIVVDEVWTRVGKKEIFENIYISEETSKLQALIKEYQNLDSTQDDFKSKQLELVKEISTEVQMMDEWKESGIELKPVLQSAYDAAIAISGVFGKTLPENPFPTDEIIDDSDDLIEVEEELRNSFDDLKDTMSSVNSAISDYNDLGGLTQRTLDDLESTLPGVTSLIYDENGALRDGADAALKSADSLFQFVIAQQQIKLEDAETNLSNTVDALNSVGSAAVSNSILIWYATKTVEEAQSNFDSMMEKYKQFQNIISRPAKKSGGGGGGGGSKKEVDPIAEQSKLFKEQIDILKHKLFLQEQIAGTEEEQIAIQKQIQKELNKQANWFRGKGLTNNSEYIRDLQKQWWKYADSIEDIQNKIIEDTNRAIEESLNKRKDDLEATFSYLQKKADEEIEALNNQKDAINEKYDSEIEKLQETNDKLEDKLTLENALKDLAEARNKRQLVYKDGKFQYVEDIQSVSDAKDKIDTIQREQQLKEDIALLEQQRDKELAVIQTLIDDWERYKQYWSSVVTDYENKQEKLLAEQVLGTSLEGKNWRDRLNNLQSYVNEYNNVLAQLQSFSGDSIGGGSSSGGGSGTVKAGADGKAPGGLAAGTTVLTQGGTYKITGVNKDGSYQSVKVDNKPTYANGTLSATGGMSQVDELGEELIVDKPNRGRYTQLSKGAGVIPAGLTRNLMDWGKYNPMNMFSQLKGVSTNETSTTNTYQFDKLVLPNVSNAQSFVEELKNIKPLAYQMAYQRG